MKLRVVVCLVAGMTGAGVAWAQPAPPAVSPDDGPFAAEVDHAEPEDIELAAAPLDPSETAIAATATPAGTAVPEPVAGAPGPILTLETPMPAQWAPSKGRGCHRYLRRRVCEGPRRVPLPHGPAAELARRLNLGPSAGQRLLVGAPAPEWVEHVGTTATPPDLLWPLASGRLWRGFGRVRGLRTGRTRNHEGVDIGAPEGTPIRAVNDALVVYSDNRISGYGNLVTLVHADGSITMYAHCRATYVFAGERVRRGQIIAEVGETGLARGAHLHFEWRMNGAPRDPIPHFVGAPEPVRDRLAIAGAARAATIHP